MRGVTAYKIKIPPSVTFLLTRLMRGVTAYADRVTISRRFLLTRLMRGVTDLLDIVALEILISTHTPHARRDFCTS